MEEKEWVRIKVLESVRNLAAQRHTIDNAIKLWEERLDAYNIHYKFDVEYKAQTITHKRTEQSYNLVLYVEKGDVPQAKTVIKENEDFAMECYLENQEPLSEFETESLEKHKNSTNIFMAIIIVIALFIEIYLLFYNIYNETINLGKIIIYAVLVIIEVCWIYENYK